MWNTTKPIALKDFATKPKGFSTLVAQIRDWQDDAVLAEAHQRWENRLPGQQQSDQRVFPEEVFVDEEDAAFPQISTHQPSGPLQYSLWFKSPDRWRSEQVMLTSEGSLPLVTAVRVGTAWWTHWVKEGVVETNTASPSDTKEFGRDVLLRPERFLSDYKLAEPPESDMWLGRTVWRAKAIPLRPIRHLGTHHEFLIDREFGCVLRQAEFLDTKPFTVQETVTIAFNEELSDDLFPLDPPSGVPIGKTAVRKAMEEFIQQSDG